MRSTRLEKDVHDYLSPFFGDECFSRLLRSLSSPPLQSTIRCNTFSIDRAVVLEHLNEKISDAERRFSAHPIINDVIVFIGDGPLSPINNLPAVVVGRGAGESILRGANVYARGILGAERGGDFVSVWTDVGSSLLRGSMIKGIDSSWIHVGNGRVEMKHSELLSGQHGLGITMTEPLYLMPSLNNLLPTEIYPQNLPSILVSHILDPQPGDTVLDMCAAPGGKTIHIATLMKNEGKVIAIEKCSNRLSSIKKQADLWGRSNVCVFHADSTRLYHASAPSNSLVPPFPGNSFDRILLDPPCSGLGNRPKFVDNTTLSMLSGFSKYQKMLMREAVSLLKEGGTLVYSTCTINPDENENVIAWALSTFPHLRLLPPPSRLRLGGPGLESADLTSEECEKVMRFDPSTDDSVSGFFIAKFELTPRSRDERES